MRLFSNVILPYLTFLKFLISILSKRTIEFFTIRKPPFFFLISYYHRNRTSSTKIKFDTFCIIIYKL
ncbi:hypothetical protein HOLDEFILI_03565 [Holdemania filiformis DSM 12042]|uniref:Uncharacterized protein n=1 Tax=Holdemania filiformis DSM 12042 TaxID=545696 RepID=B9YCK3_9FIRM|nr:hypothetical protein HOLDEFILI_03565 [Holdemania filiformis DSM 12042]